MSVNPPEFFPNYAGLTEIPNALLPESCRLETDFKENRWTTSKDFEKGISVPVAGRVHPATKRKQDEMRQNGWFQQLRVDADWVTAAYTEFVDRLYDVGKEDHLTTNEVVSLNRRLQNEGWNTTLLGYTEDYEVFKQCGDITGMVQLLGCVVRSSMVHEEETAPQKHLSKMAELKSRIERWLAKNR